MSNFSINWIFTFWRIFFRVSTFRRILGNTKSKQTLRRVGPLPLAQSLDHRVARLVEHQKWNPGITLGIWYCWWFRNPKQPPWILKGFLNTGINHQSHLVIAGFLTINCSMTWRSQVSFLLILKISGWLRWIRNFNMSPTWNLLGKSGGGVYLYLNWTIPS